MKIAAAQIACVLGDLEANLRKIVAFAERAKAAGAELVVFPEMADTGYDMATITSIAQPWSAGAVPELQALARRLSLAIICGVAERTEEGIYNSQVMVAADGMIAGRYRKAHLFSTGRTNEAECFTAGDTLSSAPLGDFQLGFSICYDLRFPEVYRTLAIEHQTNTFIVSSAWPFPRLEHLRLLATTRAVENQSYLVLANRVGSDGPISFCGSSMIIDPSGSVLAAAAPEREQLITAELSPEVVGATREWMPIFAHRRPELYRKARPDRDSADG